MPNCSEVNADLFKAIDELKAEIKELEDSNVDFFDSVALNRREQKCQSLKSELKQLYAKHHEWSAVNEIHAEQNAMMYANRADLQGATLYCTLQPCPTCSVMIAGSGIKRVVYNSYYDRSNNESSKILKKAGVSEHYVDTSKTEK